MAKEMYYYFFVNVVLSAGCGTVIPVAKWSPNQNNTECACCVGQLLRASQLWKTGSGADPSGGINTQSHRFCSNVLMEGELRGYFS